jgi:hypothetical protein
MLRLGSWIVKLLDQKLQANLTAANPAILMLTAQTQRLQISLLEYCNVMRSVSGDYVGQRVNRDGIAAGDTTVPPSLAWQTPKERKGSLADFLELLNVTGP